uniref:Uncharacterized protein n=1 Tax=Rhizophora mucronata TaxID=61149 RepID=A0A2P2JQL2_RHIMU
MFSVFLASRGPRNTVWAVNCLHLKFHGEVLSPGLVFLVSGFSSVKHQTHQI